ncbi:MAG: ABC transporter permease [Acidobacteriota bacterium]
MPVAKEIAFSFRRLARSPGFTSALVLVLALGIGANSAIFSLVDALLFRSLPVEQPDRLVQIGMSEERAGGKGFNGGASYLQYRDLSESTRSSSLLSGLAAFSNGATLDLSTDAGETVRVSGTLVSGNYFGVLGVGAAKGRALDAEDDKLGEAQPVTVLSDALWRSQFAADANIVGKTVRLNNRAFTVVGVAPAGFRGTTLEEIPDLWATLSMAPTAMPDMQQFKPFERRGFSWLDLIGRLAPGVSDTALQAQMDVQTERKIGESATLPKETRDSFPWARVTPASAATLGAERRSEVDRLSWILLGVSALVLAIACAVAAGLLLVRGERRQRELAIRLAIGASRGRVVRELLLESALIAAASAVGGWFLAAWGLRAFAAAAPAEFAIPVAAASPVSDPRVLLFTILATAVATILFGLLPAWRGSSANLTPALKNEARGAMGSGRTRFALRDGFVVLQIALSALLLVGAGLLVRTLAKASAVDLGFDADHAVAVHLDVSRQGYSREAGQQFYARLLERVRALPGVASAALAYHVPVQERSALTSIAVTNFTPPAGEEPRVAFTPVSTGFFETLGVRLLAGRDFTEADGQGESVLMVNDAFAKRYWPGRDPLGERVLNFGKGGGRVIGVVPTLRNTGVRATDQPFIYVPQSSFYTASVNLVARTKGDPRALLPVVRAAVVSLDPHLPIIGARTLRERVGAALAQERVLAALLSAFALLALALAALGLYAVVAYATELRAREFGVRLALGARPAGLLGLVLGRALTLALLGLSLGLAAALGATHWIAALLFGVPETDVVTFSSIAVLLLAIAALASVIPAARASRLHPMNVLREQ